MNDVFGNKLEIGDTVAFNRPRYRNMITGTVLAFTPKQMRVEYIGDGGYRYEYLQYPSNFAKKMT